MNKISKLIAIVLLVSLYVCSRKPVYAQSMPSHLKYFGYYGLVGGPYPYTYFFNDIGALQNSNVGIVPFNWSDTAKLREMLELARSHHIEVFVAPRWSLWDGSIAPAHLLTNYLATIQTLVPVIGDYNDVVAGFYFDEMYKTGVSVNDFVTVTKYLNDIFPGKKILAVEGPDSIDSNTIPASYFTYLTDIGFDDYFVSSVSDNTTGWSQYLEIYAKLKAQAPTKLIWIVPDGIAITAAQAIRLPDAFERYVNLAMTDPQVIGILNFIWNPLDVNPPYEITLQSVFNPASGYYNSGFKSRQISVGQAIIANNLILSPTPTTKPGDLNGDGKIDIFDYNAIVSDFGKTGSPGFSPADIDKNGKVDIFDYNELVGNFGK